PSHPGPRPSSPRGGSRRVPRRRRSGWLASPSSTSSLSRQPESGNHLATERLGAPAPDAVNPRKLGPVARARQGDHRDQAVRQKQAGLDADAWRRLAAPLPEPLDAALDGGRDPGARAVLDPRQLVIAERQPASDGLEDGVAPARELVDESALELDQMEDVGCRVVKLRLSERARRPVVLLPRGREPGAKVALEEDVETERGSAQEARPDRGVEERGEPEAVATLEVRE